MYIKKGCDDMGQRLNIEIIDKNGDAIANCYYHWSAYTVSALELTEQILNFIKKNKEKYIKDGKMDKTLFAVRMLESTGAGLCPEADIPAFKKLYPDEPYKEGTDRNSGLISITEESMDQTRNYEEGKVNIYIDSNMVFFGVLYELDDYELADIVNEDGDMEDDEIETALKEYKSKLTDIGKDYPFSLEEIPFDKFKEISQEIDNASSYFKYKGDIYTKIE